MYAAGSAAHTFAATRRFGVDAAETWSTPEPLSPQPYNL